MSNKLTTGTPPVSALSIPALNDGVFRAKGIKHTADFLVLLSRTIILASCVHTPPPIVPILVPPRPINLIYLETQGKLYLPHKTIPWIWGSDYLLASSSTKTQSLQRSQWVFVGHGIHEEALGLDDYKNQDLSHQTAIILLDDPESHQFYRSPSWQNIICASLSHHPALVILVDLGPQGQNDYAKRRLFHAYIPQTLPNCLQGESVVIGWITPQNFFKWLQLAHVNWAILHGEALDPAFKPTPLPIFTDLTIQPLTWDMELPNQTSK